MILLGLDIGSSSVKANLVDADNGKSLASSFFPKREMKIHSNKPGWAEQNPEKWWEYTMLAIDEAIKLADRKKYEIKAIGISYQMHGLVLVNKNQKIIRPSIIWCDSRAVDIGQKAFNDMGGEKCLQHLLNSPGNFTASKLKWVKDNEPDNYKNTYKFMLPGDYIAMKFTGEINTTNTGLSEGILYDFKKQTLAKDVLSYYDISADLVPSVVDVFSSQGEVNRAASEETGLLLGTPVTYRAGDQPNNAFSLNVLEPGEIAATAGTSGVVYGISDKVLYDKESRVNTFLHVNHTQEAPRLGVLLCINGTGILNAWIRKLAGQDLSYETMNKKASQISPGSQNLVILPFGNGAERMLGNKNIGSYISNLNFSTHEAPHLYRAAQEGIAFAFHYGMDIMKKMGIVPSVIRAGHANLFLSDIFRQTLSNISNSEIELYDTDGSKGAGLGAGLGAGIFSSAKEAFKSLRIIKYVSPEPENKNLYQDLYENWYGYLKKLL
jgi:xylulokinase